MNFKVGQKVLCVNDRFNYGGSGLKKGSIYTIHGFYVCACGSNQITLYEIPDVPNMRCGCNRNSIRRQSYYNWRFIPLNCFEKFIALTAERKEILKEINVESEEVQIEETLPAK